MKLAALAVVVACASPAPRETVGNTAQPAPAKPAAIVVQLAYKGTFMIGPPFSSPPPFTLLDDGTLIGVLADDSRVYTTVLARGEVDRIVKRVRDLGFDRLESHTDSCQHKGDIRMCVSDASYTILRVARPDGSLREVSTYASFSNDTVAHDAIVELLTKYRPASSRPYRPTFGILHVNLDGAPPGPLCAAIDAAVVQPDGRTHTAWAFQIDGAALDKVLAIAGDLRKFDACTRDALYHLTFVPGVPGMDVASELEPYKQRE